MSHLCRPLELFLVNKISLSLSWYSVEWILKCPRKELFLPSRSFHVTLDWLGLHAFPLLQTRSWTSHARQTLTDGLTPCVRFLSVYWPSFLNVKYLRGCYSTVPSEGARTWSFPWVIASNTLYIKGLYWCHFWCHIWCHDVIFGALPGLMGPEERLGQR